MSSSRVVAVRMVGVASAVPDQIVTAEDEAAIFGAAEMKKIARNTGIRARRVAPPGICTSDMCLEAAKGLLAAAGWNRESIDTLIFVSQTPDYILPATSCSLHGRLELSDSCATFDVNLGCSGYTHGLWLASNLIASGASRRVLLLAGETSTRSVFPQDRSSRPLFGDAGTATLLERDETAGPTYFRLGTDGSGQNHLIVPGKSFRLPHSDKTREPRVQDDGNTRDLESVYMDGSEVFLFTLSRIPPLVESILQAASWSVDQVDAFVFHQANSFILKHLAETMGVPLDKVPLGMERYGNTSSASIPLTMSACLAERLSQGSARLVLAGFGVGFSWSAVALEVDRMVMPEVIEIDTSALLDRLCGRAPSDAETSHLPESVRTLLDEATR